MHDVIWSLNDFSVGIELYSADSEEQWNILKRSNITNETVQKYINWTNSIIDFCRVKNEGNLWVSIKKLR